MSFKHYVLPISGVDFARYIAIFSELSKYGIKPEKIYCASGGCLSSYVAMMSSFTESIENWKFNSEMFIKSSTPFTPKILTFALNGFFFYRQNINDFARELFVLSKLQDVEIITGYYESVGNLNKTIITTNFTEENSSLDKNYVANYFDSVVNFPVFPHPVSDKKKNLEYLYNFCMDSMYKTSNIPFLVESLGDQEAVDFGIVAPSPFFMVNSTMNKAIYFSPIDIEQNKKSSSYEILFYNIIRKDIYVISKDYTHNIKFDTMDEVLNFIPNFLKYTLVIYCAYDFYMSLENFNPDELKKHVNMCKQNIKYKLFYNEN